MQNVLSSLPMMRMGADRFGKPNREVLKSLRAIKDAKRLDRLAVRLLRVQNWDELLAAE